MNDRNTKVKIPIDDFEIRICTTDHFSDIIRIQDEAFDALSSPDLLRRNTDEMLMDCLNPPHVTIGAWYNGELAGISILYYPGDDESDNLSLYLKNVDTKGLKSANYKLCIVKPKYRGNSLQYELGKILEQMAVKSGVKLMCATVHPDNIYSINNVLKLGFIYNRTLTKYGLERNLYYKFI